MFLERERDFRFGSLDLSWTSWLGGPTHLEQPLFLGESVSLHVPEVDVRLPTGDDQVGVGGMKHGSQDGVVGALQRYKHV